jgi:hypothetical protein
MAHSHHAHREHQVSHRRVAHILKHEPEGAKEHSKSHAFSKVTSKSAAVKHDDYACGGSAPKRYARGGKVKSKSGHQTNIAIVVPHKGAQQPMAGAPPGGAMPMPAPGGPPPGMPPGAGGPPGMPPPGAGGPPGMPMHKRGGKVIDGEADEKDIKGWSKRAKDNSYFRGGAATGVGREEKAEHQKRGKGKK